MDEKENRLPSVLIIEDDPGHQRLLEIYVKRAGCATDACYDGKTGVEMAVSKQYDLILVDIHIPELDGFMVATQLRDMGYQMPMVAVTALKLHGIERKALAVGFNDFLQKPIKQEDITTILDKYLPTRCSK